MSLIPQDKAAFSMDRPTEPAHLDPGYRRALGRAALLNGGMFLIEGSSACGSDRRR